MECCPRDVGSRGRLGQSLALLDARSRQLMELWLAGLNRREIAAEMAEFEADLRDLFGPEEFHAESQPLRFVRRGLPPMLLLHGREDRTVHPSNSARMASALREAGGHARTILYDGVSHTSIVGGLCDDLQRWIAPVLDDTVAFVEGRVRQLRAGRPIPGQPRPGGS